MNFRKTLFILPNLFTFANVFCGFLAIALCSGGPDEQHLYEAALAICFGFFFDLFDGRVARLTKTQSVLGVELDSLADVITFGAAPALLVYKWGLTSFGLWGLSVAFLFVAGAAFRLARFNVLTLRKTEKASGQVAGPDEFFIGLSVPTATAVIVSLVVVHHRVGGKYVLYSQGAIATLVVILSYLMVSRVRFRTFKHLRLTKKTLGVIFFLITGSIVITTKLRASFVFVFLISAYLALGLTEEIYRYAADRRRKRREAKLAAGQPLSSEDQDQPDENDEEVLKELGAD
ncbi:MAG: CDP-diacylglycerol--serine O-phosphatidyltransferase [Deltaproteobacteria bacterium]|nr:CDP-diacylglycerol--serine O-phosphatidyltransferase [Deltaproteobacteria bacterium]